MAALNQDLAGIQASRDGYATALKSFSTSGDAMNGDLEASVYNVVSDLGLESIGRVETQMGLGGWASTEAEVIEYARKLEATGRFSEITISNISREISSENESESMSFALALQLAKGAK